MICNSFILGKICNVGNILVSNTHKSISKFWDSYAHPRNTRINKRDRVTKWNWVLYIHISQLNFCMLTAYMALLVHYKRYSIMRA